MPGIPGIPDAHGTPKVADAPGTADASAAAGARDPAAVVPPAFVVALPTFNDARTIGGVVAAARGGLARSFAASDVRLVLADAGSNDGTREQAREAARPARLLEVECPPAPAREFPYHGHPGRASALRAVLQAAQQLGAGGCAVVDTRLEAPHAETVEQLIAPILADTADYVSPFYTRRVNEGAITKGIVYPVFRALYGVRLRQPAAGEFGCSTRFAAHCLDQDFWEAEHAQAGIDLWLATAAATGGFRVSEAALGERRAAPLEVPVDLSTTLAQVVGALFADLETRVDLWQRTR